MPIDMVWYAYFFLEPKQIHQKYFNYISIRKENKMWHLHPLADWWFDARYDREIYTSIRFPLILTAYIGKIIASVIWIIFLVSIRGVVNIFIRYAHILWLLHLYLYLLTRLLLWLKWLISPKFYYELWVLLSKLDSLCAIYWLQDLTVVFLRVISKIKPVEVTHFNVDTYKTSPPKHSSWINLLMRYTAKPSIFPLLNSVPLIKHGFLRSIFWSIFFFLMSGICSILTFIQIELKSFILILNFFMLIFLFIKFEIFLYNDRYYLKVFFLEWFYLYV